MPSAKFIAGILILLVFGAVVLGIIANGDSGPEQPEPPPTTNGEGMNQTTPTETPTPTPGGSDGEVNDNGTSTMTPTPTPTPTPDGDEPYGYPINGGGSSGDSQQNSRSVNETISGNSTVGV